MDLRAGLDVVIKEILCLPRIGSLFSSLLNFLNVWEGKNLHVCACTHTHTHTHTYWSQFVCYSNLPPISCCLVTTVSMS